MAGTVGGAASSGTRPRLARVLLVAGARCRTVDVMSSVDDRFAAARAGGPAALATLWDELREEQGPELASRTWLALWAATDAADT